MIVSSSINHVSTECLALRVLIRVPVGITGLDYEGVFRVNGNARIVERLRVSFDRVGDADLEEADDVMAVAGLLKLFLRELPETVIPERLTRQFVAVQEGRAPQNYIWSRYNVNFSASGR